MKKFKNIYIEIINVCNLSCGFCPRTCREARTMSVAEFAYALDKVSAHSEYFYLHVVGEPLMHPELSSILECCDNAGVKVKITTNGTLLKKSLGTLTERTSVKSVNISLSCIKDFDAATAQSYLDGVFFSARDLSRNKIATSLRVWTDIKYFDNIIKRVGEEFGAEILPAHRGNKRICDHLFFDVESEFVWPVMSRAEPVEKNNCLGLRKQLAILSDGTVVPCCLDSDGKLALGNIFASSLEEILAKERSVKIARGFESSKAVEPFCKTCTFSKKPK